MSNIVNADLDKIYTRMEFELGQEIEVSGKKFQFVKYNSGAGLVDAVAGQIGYFVSTATTGSVRYETTMDYNSNAAATAITTPKKAAGCYQAALTDDSYGWVQKEGPTRYAMLTDGNVAAGDQLQVHTTDGSVRPLQSGNPDLPTVGVALAADTGTALAAGDAILTID